MSLSTDICKVVYVCAVQRTTSKTEGIWMGLVGYVNVNILVDRMLQDVIILQNVTIGEM